MEIINCWQDIYKGSLIEGISHLKLALANFSEASCYDKYQKKLGEVEDIIAPIIFELEELKER